MENLVAFLVFLLIAAAIFALGVWLAKVFIVPRVLRAIDRMDDDEERRGRRD
jgi:Sec-independent protein secretion pathway component TatC